jgi:Uma2 family endonuclease
VRAPDLAVTCSERQSGKTFPDPVLIIEVLSPGNQRETWESIWACATIPSLIEIVVVDSERMNVQVFRKTDDGGWPKDGETIETSGTVRLSSIDAAFPIAEIYAGTHLT